MDAEEGEKDDGEISKALWKKAAMRDLEWFLCLDIRMRWWRNKLEFRDFGLGETWVDEIYQEHAEALHKAGLAPEDLWTTYLVIGYSQFIRDAGIPKLLKQLRQHYRL
eukprot:14725453-Ditylum_brightwellii.AAC.1